ncbi:hypothetical protein A9Q78_03555 [Methylophaga sp. 41_12_T18]|nr:hypothetical protein A9Q78_03555 [Methylophaga sp. 41_12_T18]
MLNSNDVLMEQTRQLFQAGFASNVVQIGVAAVFYAIFNSILDHSLLLLWCGAIFCIIMSRLLLYWSFHRAEQRVDVKPWLQSFTFLSALAGLAWASFSLFYLVTDDSGLKSIFVILTCGILAAAAPVMAAWRSAYYANTLPQFIALVGVLLYSSELEASYIAAALVIYYAMLISLNKEANSNILKSLHLQCKNDSLVAELNGEIKQRERLIDERTSDLLDANQRLQDSESRLNSIIEYSPVGIFYYDQSSTLITVNKHLEEILAAKRDELIGFNMLENMVDEQILSAIQQSLLGKVGHFHGLYTSVAGGHSLFLHAEFVPVYSEDGKVTGGVGVFEDITAKEEATVKLTKLSRAVECSPNAIVITSANGEIEYVNPKFSFLTGYSAEEVIGKKPTLFQTEEETSAHYQEVWQTISSGQEWRGELQNKTKSGALYWAQHYIAPITDSSGNITHYVGIQEDVTEAKEVSRKLSYQASHDELTGLINRHEFERRLNTVVDMARQDDSEHALCFLDLDQFKIINDTCGHVAGDELLRQLGLALKEYLRQHDTLARLGGDEFAILMEHCGHDHAMATADAVRNLIEQFQFLWEEHIFSVGVSIGVTEINQKTASATEALIQADSACYAAKNLGRNRVHYYHHNDEQLAKQEGEFRWVNQIKQALTENRFLLYVQPIVPLANIQQGKIYEVLLRLQGVNGDVIPPGSFLPAAERYNLSGRIDRWVIDHAFLWLQQHLQQLNDLDHLAINLSGCSLGDDALLGHIIKQFQMHRLPANKIKFEITETAAIANLRDAQVFIKTLREFGCLFALDDFGSGLSSFAYLKNLPVDSLKIDGMFVKDIIDDAIDEAMVKSINEIGHLMGMTTIAEFVENDAIKQRLTEMGVDYVQGYGIGKPIPIEQVSF